MNDKLSYWLLLAFAFSFPFGNIYGTIFIILLSILWLLSGNIFSKLKQALAQPLFLSYTLLFFLQFPWLLNTWDMARGLYLIQCNASMFALPLIILTSENRRLHLNKNNIPFALIIGCVVASLASMYIAFFKFGETSDPAVFFYTRLSADFYHPGFMSVQFSLAVIFLLLDIFGVNKIFTSGRITLKVAVAVWLFLFIIFLSSKIGLVCLILILIATITYVLRKTGSNFIRLMVLVIPLLLALIIWESDFQVRLKSAFNTLSSNENLDGKLESTATRITAIKTTLELIQNNWIAGVGTGDVWSDLRRSYFVDGKSACLKERVIPHNQFLNSLAKHGIAGLTALLLLLVLPLIFSVRKKYMAGLCFMILIILNCMVEDVFEVQNGVVFTSFFYSLIFLIPEYRET